VRACALDNNYHVRRLATEGIRPMLPCSVRVKLPLPEIISVLDLLHADPTRYVTRAVANNLNDISKLESDLVYACLQRRHDLRSQTPAELDWMTPHALRTLNKIYAPKAL